MRLLEASRPLADTISWNAAISACEKAGAWPAALRLFAALETAPTRVTANAVLLACKRT